MIPKLSDFIFEFYELKDDKGGIINRRKGITEEEWIDLYHKNCEYNPNAKMYRGLNKALNDFLYVNPSKFEIGETNAHNFLAWIIDESKEWKNYPKRTKSIFAATEQFIAGQYGGFAGASYVVIPYKNSKIAVCKDYDFWSSHFVNINGKTFELDWYHFNQYLKDLDLLYNEKTTRNKTDIKYYIDIINKNKEIIINKSQKEQYISNLKILMKNWENYELSFDKYINKLLDPKITKSVSLENYNKIIKLPESKNGLEIYTDAECLLIRPKILEHFIKNNII